VRPRTFRRALATVVLGALACCTLPSPASSSSLMAQRMLVFRGPLRDSGGKPLTAPVDLVFRVFDAPAGGNSLAGPFGPVRVAPRGGLYSTLFGPVDAGVWAGRRVWLEISFQGAPPRRVEMEDVSFDWLDERGKLAGDRTLVSGTERSTLTQAERTVTAATTILSNGPSANRIDWVFVGDGYVDSELGTYAAQVQNLLSVLLSQEPFSSYRTLFNAHRVDVVSNESGIDNDPLGVYKDTALDMSFGCGGVDRALCVDIGKAYQYASMAPEIDAVFALANSAKYGGTGYFASSLAAVAAGNPAAGEVTVHETGHSFGKLADEYEYDGPYTYFGPEPVPANVSTLDAEHMAASGTKWARWLGDPGVGFGGTVGTYEGGMYSYQGIYRPTFDSKMRNLGQPFNLPSVEDLILYMYHFVRPIDGATPIGTMLDEFSTAFVDPIDPLGHRLDIQWSVDGTPIPGETQETFHLCTGTYAVGDHLLSVTVQDNTPWVRDDAQRSQWMSETRSWSLHIGGSNARDCAPLVTAPNSEVVAEGTPLVFSVAASDPNGDPIALLSASGTAMSAGATFTQDPSHTLGTFQWTPGFDRAGSYAVTFTAANTLSSSITTQIAVTNVNLPPSVVAPASVTGGENTSILFDVSGSDPDGEMLYLDVTSLPPGADFDDHGNNTGTFSWQPSYDQAGSYVAAFLARDGSGAQGTAQTSVLVTPTDRAPVVIAPTADRVAEGDRLSLPVSASDPDGDALQTLEASGVPPGATFSGDPGTGAGLFEWRPAFDQAGVYTVTFRCSNALEGAANTAITVTDVPRTPAVTAPASVRGPEGAPLSFDVSASDPDGQPIDSLTARPLPPGATFTVHSGKTGATLAWSPDYAQAGEYAITIAAQSACRATVVSGVVVTECETGSSVVPITIDNVDRAPSVEAPVSRTVDEGAALGFTVTVSDPDGEPIAALAAAPLPAGAGFTPAPDRSSGLFAWSPSYSQAGTYTVSFTASNALATTVLTGIVVRDVELAPLLSAPESIAGEEGKLLAFDVHGTDADGDPLTLTKTSSGPVGATFVDHGDKSGTFTWTPDFTQAGAYRIRFLVTDPSSAEASAETAVAVSDRNRPPVPNPGGPYAGVAGVAIHFVGSGSADPDGNDLRFSWDFDATDGIGTDSTSPDPDHAYAAGGVYTATLSIDDGGSPDPGVPILTAAATTTATVQAAYDVRLFSKSSVVRLQSGQPVWCAHIEALPGSFALTDVDLGSIVVKYGILAIGAIQDKTVLSGDQDRNGIPEIQACWSKSDLRSLFSSLPAGHNPVTVTIEGNVGSGGRFSGALALDVVASSRPLAAAVSPNPSHDEGTLSFFTTQDGFARVQIFDTGGRLVQTLLDVSRLPAGPHGLRVPGFDLAGHPLSSGIYFFRIQTQEGSTTGRLVIAR